MVGMRRREVLGVLGSAAVALPFEALAQKRERQKHVGVLMIGDPVRDQLVATFVERLRQLGWADGRNVRIDFRWLSDDAGKYPFFAKEIVELNPDVILGQGNIITALHQTTTSIPIVFAQVSDPVGRGFAATLARPGGNITGFTNFEASMSGKWLEKLKEIALTLHRVALIFNPLISPHIAAGFYLRAAEEAGQRVDVEIVSMPVRDVPEMEQSIEQLAASSDSGLIVLPDGFTNANADLIVALAARFGLPTIYAFRLFATHGGLIYYGIDPKDQYAGAASYVDRILRGASAAELPIQAPSKFELIVNLRTAKALGLDVPLQLQQLADEVIE
jgi:ABC-type uncharacterized transport system substrate-binding protein